MRQGRDSLTPHGCVGLRVEAIWGQDPETRCPRPCPSSSPSSQSWPGQTLAPQGWGAGASQAKNPNWGRGKDTQGQSWQVLAPCPLLPPTPRTHFLSLAALGPLYPEHSHQHLQVLCVPLLQGCVPQSPSPALSAGRDALTLALSTIT